jgi:penicillin-insensitive murein endopeptidase
VILPDWHAILCPVIPLCGVPKLGFLRDIVPYGLALLLAVRLAPLSAARAEPPPNRWSQVTGPAKGSPRSLGEYSSGCLRGASKLALDGPGYQVMHPSRGRYYGHPELVDFVQKLGQALHAQKLADLMVGDLSQARGGPAPGGHSSHQTGLDVDLWYWQPKAAAHGPLPRSERESTKAQSVLDGKAGTVRAELGARVATLLRLAASDARVTRIFVHPLIKRMLCADADTDRGWLTKIRPWYGHDDHFHVRLQCPVGDETCVHQTSVAAGDGCADLDWWFSKEREADRSKGRATYQAKVGQALGMPAECLKLLDAPAAAPPTAARSAAGSDSVGAISGPATAPTAVAAP